MRIDIPLLHDHHSHGSLYAALAGSPDISSRDAAGALGLLRSLPDDSLTLVTGYRNAVHRIEPGELAGLPPAVIVNSSLHGYLVTDSAQPFLRESCPEIAAYRDDTAWKEAHISYLFACYTSLAGLDDAKLGAFIGGLEKLGIGSTEDMSVSAGAYKIIRRSPFRDRFVLWMSPEEYDLLGTEERSDVRGIKLYLDGSLGARTAAIRGRYRDGGGGMLTWRYEDLRETAERFVGGRAGNAGTRRDAASIERTGRACEPAPLGLSLHAIGENAIDQALILAEDLMRSGTVSTGGGPADTEGRLGESPRAGGPGGGAVSGVRIEHAQFITFEQARRARDIDVVLSMQPNFTGDSVDYADRLDPERLAANNPFRMLIDRAGFVPGRDLIFGSDGMPHGAACAFRWSLSPPYPGQRLTVEELVAGYGEARGGAHGSGAREGVTVETGLEDAN